MYQILIVNSLIIIRKVSKAINNKYKELSREKNKFNKNNLK